MDELTHTDNTGKAVMVDIGQKEIQLRSAKASGHIRLAPETLRIIEDNLLQKGDVLTVAQLAGIKKKKKTSDLIPLCHPLPLTNVEVDVKVTEKGVVSATATVKTKRGFATDSPVPAGYTNSPGIRRYGVLECQRCYRP